MRLGCNLTLSPVLIPLLTRAVAEELPHVQLDIVEGSAAEILAKIRSAELEAGLVFRRQVRGGAELVPIKTIRARVVLPKDHPLANRTGVSLRELVGEPAILPAEGSSHSIGLSLLRAAGVEPTVRWTFVSPETIRTMVAHGYGYSVFHVSPPPDERTDPRIVYVPVVDHIEGSELVLALPPVREQLSVVRQLISVLHGPLITAALD